MLEAKGAVISSQTFFFLYWWSLEFIVLFLKWNKQNLAFIHKNDSTEIKE
jgi:hypothetical protein